MIKRPQLIEYKYLKNDGSKEIINTKFTVGALKALLSYFSDDDKILVHDIMSGTTALVTGLMTGGNPDDISKVIPYLTFVKEAEFNIFEQFGYPPVTFKE